MMIHEITSKVGREKARRRIGRGEGSGRGGTSGRGHKGAHSRSGWSRKKGYEGGQNPIIRRLPKRGFNNYEFANTFAIVNIADLEKLCKAGEEVTAASLAAAGVIRNDRMPLKVLGEGTLSKKLTVTAAKFSAMAKKKIEEAGGKANEEPPMKWTRAGRVSKINPKAEKREDPKVVAANAKLAAKKDGKGAEGKAKKQDQAKDAPKKERKPKAEGGDAGAADAPATE